MITKLLFPSQLSFDERCESLISPRLALVLLSCYCAQSGQPFIQLLPFYLFLKMWWFLEVSEFRCLRDGVGSPHSASCICRIQLEFQFLRHFFVLLSVVFPVTTLRQRLLQPDFQPICASQLYPRHKHLLIKRSLRCRVGNSIQRCLFQALSTWVLGNGLCDSLLKEMPQMLLVVESSQPS